MAESITPEIKVAEDLNQLSEQAAENIGHLIEETLAKQGRFTFVLSGGNTPQPLYSILATKYADRLPWEKVHFFWGDERFVDPTDEQSNVKMIRKMLLDHLEIPIHHAHPMPTSFKEPEEAARNYEDLLHSFFSDAFPVFDLVLLGLGQDGHTASLFPKSETLNEERKWVTVEKNSPKPPPTRLSLTYPAINHAQNIFFLVSGKKKAKPVQKILETNPDKNKYPAAGIQPVNGTLSWWLDKAAARKLSGF